MTTTRKTTPMTMLKSTLATAALAAALLGGSSDVDPATGYSGRRPASPR
jgi:hypothetical protein